MRHQQISSYFDSFSFCLDPESANSDSEDCSLEEAVCWIGCLNCTNIMVMLSHPSPAAVDGAKHLSSTLSHTAESLLSWIFQVQKQCWSKGRRHHWYHQPILNNLLSFLVQGFKQLFINLNFMLNKIQRINLKVSYNRGITENFSEKDWIFIFLGERESSNFQRETKWVKEKAAH